MEQLTFQPQPGPQTEFLKSRAGITVYGGQAGSGKSYGIAMNAARCIDITGYRGLVLRRLSTQLEGGGSIWEKMEEIYPHIGGKPLLSKPPFWKFTPNAKIETGHLQYAKDVYSYQGRDFPYIAMDEATQFEASQLWYMRSRMRSMTGIIAKMDLPCNPDPDSEVRKLIDWWIDRDGFPIWQRSGVLRYFYRINEDLDWHEDPKELRHIHRNHPVAQHEPTSLTFIPAKLEDNPALLEKDPTYKARLMELPYVERMRLLEGNWNVRPSAGMYFQSHWFEAVDTVEPRQIMREVRAWDFAATKAVSGNTDPDWTRGVKLALMRDGKYVVTDVVSLREGPPEVERAYLNTASHDGRTCEVALWQDPGSAGKADADHKARVLTGYRVVNEVATKDKVTYAGPVSSAAEQGKLRILRAPWNAEFLHELEAFPEGAHDDIVDALSRAFRHLTTGLISMPKPIGTVKRQTSSLVAGSKRGMWR